MNSKLTRENLAELDAAARRLDFYPVPPKDSQLKLVEKQKEIAAANVPLEVDDSKVAERIKQASENSGITFTDLARGCDVTDKVVWQWAATGKISKAKLPILARLCDVTVTWLLTGEEQSTLFAPTDDKFVQSRQTDTGFDVTSYYPLLTPAELVDPDASLEIFLRSPNDHPCLAWVGAEGAIGKPKFACIMNVNWYPPLEVGDTILYATDLIPQANDLVIVKKNGRVSWGFLHPVGSWVHNGFHEKQFNAIKTWRISQHRDDQAHLSDVVVDDLKLDDVLAVAIARWTPLTHGVIAATSPTFDIQQQNFKHRGR